MASSFRLSVNLFFANGCIHFGIPHKIVNSFPKLKWTHFDVIPNEEIYINNNGNHLILSGGLSLFSDSPLIFKVSGKSDLLQNMRYM